MSGTKLLQAVIAATLGLSTFACGGGGGGGPTPTEPPPGGEPSVVTVEVRDDAYSPRRITIAPGTTVRWVMRGAHQGHTVTERSGVFDSGFVFQEVGDAFERRFPESEDGQTFEYSCATHAACCDMKGSIRVGNSAPPPSPGY